MEDIKSDSAPIKFLVESISKGQNYLDAIAATQKKYPIILPSTFEFTKKTLNRAINGNTHEAASSFFFGREDPIPAMFISILKNLKDQKL
jgi:hypothetical protein